MVLFALGVFLVLSRSHFILALMGVELMLNAASLNLVAFAQFDPSREGHLAVLLVMAVSAAEIAVGLAIGLQVYRTFGSIDLQKLRLLRDE